ncbi:hypothetical protein AB4915_09905 [Bifidobacterium dentium]|uniref:hypothetical protein n=1 Tax=Bifidobacterium dentium TaxID=1689 RepID=UPI003D167476
MAFGEHALVPVIRNGLPLCFPIKDSAVVPPETTTEFSIVACRTPLPDSTPSANVARTYTLMASWSRFPSFSRSSLGTVMTMDPSDCLAAVTRTPPHGHRRVARRVEPELAFCSVADLEAQAGLVGVGEQGDLAGRSSSVILMSACRSFGATFVTIFHPR